MAENWSREENEAAVNAYLEMLYLEIRGEQFNKAARERSLSAQLPKRGRVSQKLQNITAVLNELGVPGIEGYKPLAKYQRDLAEVVAERFRAEHQLIRLLSENVESPFTIPEVDDILAALVAPPGPRVPGPKVRERHVARFETSVLRPAVNYLEREARNRALGTAGELFVIRYEQARLIAARKERLAAKVEHTSSVRGDGAGYDILSFENDGQERLIEVKTTRFARETPFFVSRNEVEVSKQLPQQYYLYRCFGFRSEPRLFTVPGSLSSTCILDPSVYEASVA